VHTVRAHTPQATGPTHHHNKRGKQAAAPQQQSSDADSGEQGDHPGVSACPLLCNTFLRHIMSSAPPPPPPPRRDWRNMTRTLAHYERIEQIGEGTYGQVYRAKCLDTGRIVALKKIRVHHGGYWGMPPTVIREIKILKKLQHPNLVEMLEVVSSKGVEYLEEDDEAPRQSKNSSNRIVDAREGFKGNIYLVLEYVSHDLTGLMDVAYRFTEQQIKSIFHQLLQALEYMHHHKYIHRDIKSSNILIDSHFCVKLADFGLSRSIEPPILENIHE
jgi:serine/threonine protein kinase